MHALDENQNIVKFSSAEEVVDTFVLFRLPSYVLRKDVMCRRLQAGEARARNKARFVNEILHGSLALFKQVTIPAQEESKSSSPSSLTNKSTDKEKATMIEYMSTSLLSELLVSKKYDSEESITHLLSGGSSNISSTSHTSLTASPHFSYLLDMPIRSFTRETVQKLNDEAVQLKKELDLFLYISPEQLWHDDIQKIETEIINTSSK